MPLGFIRAWETANVIVSLMIYDELRCFVFPNNFNFFKDRRYPKITQWRNWWQFFKYAPAINLHLWEIFQSCLQPQHWLQVHRHLRPGLAQALAQARRRWNDAAPWPSGGGTAGSTTSDGNFGGAGDGDLHLSQDFHSFHTPLWCACWLTEKPQ